MIAVKTITLILSAGTLVLGPMLAATIRDHKEAIGQARQAALTPEQTLALTCILAQACAARVDPNTTLADIENLLDLENYGRVFGACWGITIPDAPEGEPAAVQANPST